MRVTVTGGAGFIGSNYVRHALATHPGWRITVLDKLTYAGSWANLPADPRLCLLEGDVCDPSMAARAVEGADAVVHLAAESHVDRSIMGGREAVNTNVLGTFTMLEAARAAGVRRFLHVSTDEVYGARAEGVFTEKDALNPRNPYSASKAGADRMAYAFFVTYGLPVVISRPSNNYGPYQYPEKLVPFFVMRALRDDPLPVYGDGMQIRDWLHVADHCRAMDLLLERGEPGEAYNIPGGAERPNMDTVRLILDEMEKPESLITHVEDRPGHDVRYALDGSKIAELGWQPTTPWEQGMRATVRWLVEHRNWLERAAARSAEFFANWYAGRA